MKIIYKLLILICLISVVIVCFIYIKNNDNKEFENTVEQQADNVENSESLENSNDTRNEQIIEKDETIQEIGFDDDDYEKGHEEDLKNYYSSEIKHEFDQDEIEVHKPLEETATREMKISTEGADSGELIFIVDDEDVIKTVKDD